jgi:hypothetical protein
VEQIQLIQRSQDPVEVRYTREQPLSPRRSTPAENGFARLLATPSA